MHLENKFFECCLPIVESIGLELYDIEYFSQNSLLRLYIENPQTKTAKIEECAAVDRALSLPFEEVEWIPENLVLEVSSPGIFRHLKYRSQFEKAIEQRVELSLTHKFEQLLENKSIVPCSDFELPTAIKKAKKAIGILKNIKGNEIVININGCDLLLNVDAIKKANVSPEL